VVLEKQMAILFCNSLQCTSLTSLHEKGKITRRIKRFGNFTPFSGEFFPWVLKNEGNLTKLFVPNILNMA